MDHVIHGVLSASVKKSSRRLFHELVLHACLRQGVGRGTEASLYAMYAAHASLDQFACSRSDSVRASNVMPHCHCVGVHVLPVHGHLPDRACHDQRSAVVLCTSPTSSLSGMVTADLKQWHAQQVAMPIQLTLRWTSRRTWHSHSITVHKQG